MSQPGGRWPQVSLGRQRRRPQSAASQDGHQDLGRLGVVQQGHVTRVIDDHSRGHQLVIDGVRAVGGDQSVAEAGQQALLKGIALKRLGTPQDIANGVLFFASEHAGWISGQTISIDGGK